MGSPEYHYIELMKLYLKITTGNENIIKDIPKGCFEQKNGEILEYFYKATPFLEKKIQENEANLNDIEKIFFAGYVVNQYLESIKNCNDALNACLSALSDFLNLLNIPID